MKVILLSYYYCQTSWQFNPPVNHRGHIEVPKTLCGKCLNELDYEIREADTGATKAMSDDSGDR